MEVPEDEEGMEGTSGGGQRREEIVGTRDVQEASIGDPGNVEEPADSDQEEATDLSPTRQRCEEYLDRMRQWALDSRIPSMHLSSLLKIQADYMPFGIPQSAMTLMKVTDSFLL